MNDQDHLSPVERNVKLLVQVNAYLAILGRDTIDTTSQTVSNTALERQLTALQADYRASKQV